MAAVVSANPWSDLLRESRKLSNSEHKRAKSDPGSEMAARSLAGNPDSPQAGVFLTSIIDEIVDVAPYYIHYHAI